MSSPRPKSQKSHTPAPPVDSPVDFTPLAVTPQRASELSGMSVKTIFRKMAAGTLRCVPYGRRGKAVLYADLKRFVEGLAGQYVPTPYARDWERNPIDPRLRKTRERARRQAERRDRLSA